MSSGDFYDTVAQVFPLLLLALLWDSAFLERLRAQQRVRGASGPGGVRFWTKPRVRVYMLFVAFVVTASIAVVVFVLAGVIPDTFTLRVVLSCALLVLLGTLLTRVYYDVIAATASRQPPADGQGGDEPNG